MRCRSKLFGRVYKRLRSRPEMALRTSSIMRTCKISSQKKQTELRLQRICKKTSTKIFQSILINSPRRSRSFSGRHCWRRLTSCINELRRTRAKRKKVRPKTQKRLLPQRMTRLVTR